MLGSQPPTQSTSAKREDQTPEKIEQLPARALNLSKYLSGGSEHQAEGQGSANTIEVLNSIRTREITSKAIAGLILAMLKWFRLSRKLMNAH